MFIEFKFQANIFLDSNFMNVLYRTYAAKVKCVGVMILCTVHWYVLAYLYAFFPHFDSTRIYLTRTKKYFNRTFSYSCRVDFYLQELALSTPYDYIFVINEIHMNTVHTTHYTQYAT